ncbi:hypothetical protein M0811_06443 [Anaeramoeba ignava]|uniref:Uncharacterized protein n=1 Tax=Anaeramoeba ignava TaxID=1746090 RepID=A0A9Q0LP75_ANAIG|nr:hypothetical protein M0811_06443 [Anaeramoeba ignava]
MTSSVTVAQATTIIYGIIIGIYGFIVSLVHKTTKAGLVMSVIGISVFIIVLTILLIKFRGGVFILSMVLLLLFVGSLLLSVLQKLKFKVLQNQVFSYYFFFFKIAKDKNNF